jgi:site-specific DNA recombinase
MTEKTEKIKVLGYTRISTTEQIDNSSLKVQRDSIRSYCKSRGWNLVEIYEDVSSGGNVNRPGFQELERNLDENGFDFVVVRSICRLSRSIIDGSSFVEKLFSKGKYLVSVNESIDTSTVQGKMIYNLLLVVSQNERDTIKERLSSGRTELLKSGKLPSSYVYGYKRNDVGDFTLIEEESQIVQEMYDLYVQYESLGRVEKEFQNRGFKTRGGNNFTRQTINGILTNPVYCSKGFRWKGKVVEGNDIPKIVTTTKWNKVQRIIDSRSRKKKVKE